MAAVTQRGVWSDRAWLKWQWLEREWPGHVVGLSEPGRDGRVWRESQGLGPVAAGAGVGDGVRGLRAGAGGGVRGCRRAAGPGGGGTGGTRGRRVCREVWAEVSWVPGLGRGGR